jgi:D-galacturonate reductase
VRIFLELFELDFILTVSWAGKSSDISYYLNSHHVDYHCWMMDGRGRPVNVTALASSGIAQKEPIQIDTEG